MRTKIKVKFVVIIVLIFISFSGCGIKQLFSKNLNSYVWIFEQNWKLDLPDGGNVVYEKDTGTSFHGDGIRYHIVQYDDVAVLDNTFEWNTEKGFLVGEDSYKLKVDEWLNEIGVSPVDRPDIDHCDFYYEKTSDSSELIVLLDRNLLRLYILERFM